jgi:hypothetical protein
MFFFYLSSDKQRALADKLEAMSVLASRGMLCGVWWLGGRRGLAGIATNVVQPGTEVLGTKGRSPKVAAKADTQTTAPPADKCGPENPSIDQMVDVRNPKTGEILVRSVFFVF